MRHPARRKPRRRNAPRRKLVVVVEPKGRARYYRGPGSTVVVWKDGKFEVRPGTDPSYVRTLARMPKGLARRVHQAQQKGMNHG